MDILIFLNVLTWGIFSTSSDSEEDGDGEHPGDLPNEISSKLIEISDSSSTEDSYTSTETWYSSSESIEADFF